MSYEKTSINSVSRILLNLELLNKGNIDCEMVRHLAPVTVNKIIKGLPIQDRIHKFKDQFVYIETGIESGTEKPRTHFKSGEIGFMTSNGALCFFLQDAIVSPMSQVGILRGSTEFIKSASTGDIIVIKRK
ncbi:MAG TPA: cyclophilin-like family protein [Nitrososphaeraceae archaeon]|jgi:hypothetical protein